jgi:demethylmenaquinone methyltransferase / 2-methoxy-6-polyprenyl-1,4-benzoquinol methylase
MANKYYQPGRKRADQVNALFAAVASRYDRINDLQSLGLHRQWKRRLAALVDLREGERALDVCCGTGDIAFRLARPGASVVGLDFNGAMLSVACDRARERRPRRAGGVVASFPSFIRGDGQRLPFADATFDAVTVGYGLRNLADWRRGLEEIRRVARTGGRILILDFGKPPNRVWRAIYFSYLNCVVPIFGRVFCGDTQAYAYILESLREYPAQEGVALELRKLGAGDVRTIQLLAGAMSITLARKEERGPI